MEGGVHRSNSEIPHEMKEYIIEESEDEEEKERALKMKNPYVQKNLNGKITAHNLRNRRVKKNGREEKKKDNEKSDEEEEEDKSIIFHSDSDDETIIWDTCIEKSRELWHWLTTKKVTYLRSSFILITWVERMFAYALVLSVPFIVWQLWPVIQEENQGGRLVRYSVYFVCTLLILFFTVGQKNNYLRINLIGPTERMFIVLLLFTSSLIVWGHRNFEEKKGIVPLHYVNSVDIIPLEKQNRGQCNFRPEEGRSWKREDLEQLFVQCPKFMETKDVVTVSSEKERIKLEGGWTEYDVKLVHGNIMERRNLACICPVMYGERFSMLSIYDIKDSKGKPALLLNPRVEVIISGPRSRTVEIDPAFGGDVQEIYRKDHIELHYENRYGHQKVRMLRGIKSHCVQSCMEKMYPFGERPMGKNRD